jgi:heterotetrameric sarcosine oxidase delta subunit
MSFLLQCPTCGPRSVYEFRFGGEAEQMAASAVPETEWTGHYYIRANVAGLQREWWFHRSGCRQWLQAVRNTVTNEVLEVVLPDGGQR